MIHIIGRDVEPLEIEPKLFGIRLIDGGMGSRHLALLQGWLEPGGCHSPHSHDSEEAVVFVSGTGRLQVGAEEQAVAPGDAVLIPPGIVHSTLNDGPERLTFVAAFSKSVVRTFAVGADPSDPSNWMPDRPAPTPRRNRIRWRLILLLDRLRAWLE